MPSGSFTLPESPLDMVELACDKCRRKGRLLKAKLIEARGADITLPDLRTAIARCDRIGSIRNACGAYYLAVKTNRLGADEAGMDDPLR